MRRSAAVLALLTLAAAVHDARAGVSARLRGCLGDDSVAGLITGAVPLNSSSLPLPRASIETVLADLSAPRRAELTQVIEAMRTRGVSDENIEKLLGLYARGCSIR